MNTKNFLIVLVGAAVAGVLLGGAFITGVALGRTQADEGPEVSTLQAPTAPEATTETTLVQIDPAEMQRLRQQVASGEITQDEVVGRIRSRLGSQAGPGGFGSFAPSGGLTGTVSSTDEGSISLETGGGRTVQVAVGPDTKVRALKDIPLSDLARDSNVFVTGEQSDSGGFQASAVFVIPEEGLGVFRGMGGGSGRGDGVELRSAP